MRRLVLAGLAALRQKRERRVDGPDYSATATSASPSIYLQGIDNGEIIETVHARRAPMIPVTASLRL